MKHQSKDLCQTEWEMFSDLLDGQELPQSINEQIYGLRDGTHVVVPREKWESMRVAMGILAGAAGLPDVREVFALEPKDKK